MTSLAVVALSLSAGLLACAGDPTAPGEPLRSLQVVGRVADPSGVPLSGANVHFQVEYSRDWKDPLEFDTRAWAMTEPDGTYLLDVPELAARGIESVSFTIYAAGCFPVTSSTVVRGEDLPDGPNGQFEYDLTGPAAPPPAVTTVGQVCAQSDDRGMGIAMKMDSLRGDLVYGHWAVFYQVAAVGPDGGFVGVQRDGLLAIVLQPAPDFLPGCTELRLLIPIGAGGAWGPADVLRDDGCLPDGSDGLVFVPISEEYLPM